jgi:hypothetical protein
MGIQVTSRPEGRSIQTFKEVLGGFRFPVDLYTKLLFQGQINNTDIILDNLYC